MIKNILSLLFICQLSITALAQEKNHKLPAVDVKTLDGKTFNTANFDNGGKPIIIDFWATWCKPCVKELNAIAEVYEEWEKETGVKVIAISIDDARNMAKVGPFVNGESWDYDVYIDSNGDFKRAMNVNNVPHTFLLNGNKEIVWQHNSYSEGDEKELLAELKKLKAVKKPTRY